MSWGRRSDNNRPYPKSPIGTDVAQVKAIVKLYEPSHDATDYQAKVDRRILGLAAKEMTKEERDYVLAHVSGVKDYPGSKRSLASRVDGGKVYVTMDFDQLHHLATAYGYDGTQTGRVKMLIASELIHEAHHSESEGERVPVLASQRFLERKYSERKTAWLGFMMRANESEATS